MGLISLLETLHWGQDPSSPELNLHKIWHANCVPPWDNHAVISPVHTYGALGLVPQPNL